MEVSTAANPPAAAAPARFGEVYDRGYAHYEGPRLGRRHAIWALIVYSVKRALGIKKSWTAKVIPIILYVGVSLPVIVGIGIRAFLPSAKVLQYPTFFGLIFTIEGIFVATVAPEMLCGDRRENVLPLYFSRAITRLDYLVAKLIATAILTLTISFVPALILWLGFQLLEKYPLTAMWHHLGDLGHIAVAGTLIAFYLGAGGLTIASFTGRKSVAVAVTIILFLSSTVLAQALFHAVSSGIRRYFVFISTPQTVIGLVNGLFNTRSDPMVSAANFSVWIYIIAMSAVVLIGCAIMYWRYVPHD